MPPASRQALVWSGVAVDLLRGLKDRGVRAAALACADVVVEHTPAAVHPLVAVPASRSGRDSRGFDQAELIARRCGAVWGVDVFRALERVGPGQQRGASLRERRSLTRGAFRVCSPSAPKEVVLIDDVVTTGSTMVAAAGALRSAGWRVVGTRAVARVIRGGRRGYGE